MSESAQNTPSTVAAVDPEQPHRKRRFGRGNQIRPIGKAKRTRSTASEHFTDAELADLDDRYAFSVPSTEQIHNIQQQATQRMTLAAQESVPCCVCELDCEREEVSVYEPTETLLAEMRRRLVVTKEMNVPLFVQKQYDASHIAPQLKGLLLFPPAIPHFDGIVQLQICKTCMTELRSDRSDHPPTLAIANGNYVGSMPNEYSLGRTDEQAVALVSPCMSLSTVTGGACRTIKSHHYVVKNTEGPIVSMLPKDLTTRVRVTMVGSMTSVQAAACRKRYELNLPRCRSALAFLYKNNRDYQAYMHEVGADENGHDRFDVQAGNVLMDQSDLDNAVGLVDEDTINNVRDDSSHSRRDVEEGDESLETQWEDRSSVILPQDPSRPSGSTDMLVRKSSQFVSLDSWAVCTKMFPVLFPGGCGGPNEPRRRHLSIQKWIQRCLRIHGHRFERHYAFLLLAFDYLATKNARETLFFKMHVSSAALKASQIPRSTLHEALKYYEYVTEVRARGCKPRPPPSDVQRVIDVRRGLRSPESAYYGSNLSRMRTRHDVFGMLKRFGPMQLFLTVSPDSSGTYSIAVRSEAVRATAVRDANLHLLPNKSERRAIAAQHPVECARYFVRVIDTVIEDFLGWDTKCGRPKRGGGIFGVVRAFAGAAETQVAGDLHAHFIVWLHGFPQTSVAMGQALEGDDQFRMRLLNLADSILVTKPPCISQGEERTCPKCHSRNSLLPVVPGIDAFRRPSPGKKPETTAQCSVCHKCFRDRDVINAAIEALALRDQVHVVAQTSDYMRCRPPVYPETAIAVSLIVRDVQVHFWNHARSCFKVTFQTPKGTVCRFFKPEQPHLGSTCIENGKIRLHRPIGCEYVNGYNETLLSVLKCNHDVQFVLCSDSKNTAAYLCKYCMKTQNPVENNAALSIAAFAKGVDGSDRLPPESTPTQVGRSILGSMLYTITNGQEVAAPMAALYILRASPFWFSHMPIHVNLGVALDMTSDTEEISVSPSEVKKTNKPIRTANVLTKYHRRPVLLEKMSFIDFCEQNGASERSSSDHVALDHAPGIMVVSGRQIPDISSHVTSSERDFYYFAILTLFQPHRETASILQGLSPQLAYAQFLRTGEKTLVDQMKTFEDRLRDAYKADITKDDSVSRESELMRTHPPPSTPWEGNIEPTTSTPSIDEMPQTNTLFDETISSTRSIHDLVGRAHAVVDSVRSLRASITSAERGYHTVQPVAIPPDFPVDLYGSQLVKASVASDVASTGTELFIQQFSDARTRLELFRECFQPVPWSPPEVHHLDPADLPMFPTIETTSKAFRLNFWQHSMFEVAARHLLVAYQSDIKSELYEPMFPEEHQCQLYEVKPQLVAYMGGEAGTGKSTVIHALLRFAEKWGRRESVETLAFTGVAAINIHGRTLHSARHLKLHRGEPNGTPSLEMKARFRQVVLVIIDELSMTDQGLLGGTDAASESMAPASVTGQGILAIADTESGSISTASRRIMGGKHLLMVGDWFQLPPVRGSPCFSIPTLADNRFRQLGYEAYMKINFVIFLTENMRARDDPLYTDLLSNLRWCRLSDGQLELLNSRVQHHLNFDTVSVKAEFYRPIVVSTNKLRCAINTDMTFRAAARHNVPVYECLAVPSSRSRTIVDNLTNANDDQTDHIPIRLLFYIGMPIMATRKHPDLLDAEVIANGVLGSIVGFIPTATSDLLETVVDGVRVYKFKQHPKLLLVKILSSTKTFVSGFPPGVVGLPPLKAVLSLEKIPNLAQATVTVQQFPVVPAFACTTEKLQGQTCHDGIIVTKLERQKGLPHQTLYVALSRSTSLAKVTLTEPITRDYLKKFKPKQPTIRETERLIALVAIPPYAPQFVVSAFRSWLRKQTQETNRSVKS